MHPTLTHTPRLAATVILLSLCAAAAEASTVQFTQSTYDVAPGAIFTVDLVGTDFSSGPDGAAFSLNWDPAVLNYVNTTIANPPWDTSFISDGTAAAGAVEYIFLNKSVGNAGSNFALASFTFQVVGNCGTHSLLALSNDPYDIGFVAPGAEPLNVSYVNSDVRVVPLPAAVWLFGSGILAFTAAGRRRRAFDPTA